MKKLILVLLAAVAFSCGDGNNRSSEREDGNNDMDNRETVEPDTTQNTLESDEMESDTSEARVVSVILSLERIQRRAITKWSAIRAREQRSALLQQPSILFH